MEVLSRHRDRIRGFGVRRVGLFGSALRGDFSGDSDIDILVEFRDESESFTNLMGLYHFLCGLFDRKVDIVTRNGLSPYIGPHILENVRYVPDLG